MLSFRVIYKVSFIFDAPERDARLSYAVAVAIAETIASFGVHPTIKWPNDILVDGKKIAPAVNDFSDAVIAYDNIAAFLTGNPKNVQ